MENDSVRRSLTGSTRRSGIEWEINAPGLRFPWTRWIRSNSQGHQAARPGELRIHFRDPRSCPPQHTRVQAHRPYWRQCLVVEPAEFRFSCSLEDSYTKEAPDLIRMGTGWRRRPEECLGDRVRHHCRRWRERLGMAR